MTKAAEAQKEVSLRILPWYAKAKTICSPWHGQIKKWRDLYNFKHYPGKGKPGEPQYSDPTYTNVTDLAVGILLANQVEWTAYGWTPQKDEEKTSSHIEKFLSGVLQINCLRREENIPYEIFLQLVRDGAAVLYTVWDPKLASKFHTTVDMPDAEDGEGTRTQEVYTEVPLHVQVIDPLKVFVIPGGPHRWRAVFRVEKKNVYDIETQYGVQIAKYVHLSKENKMEQEGELIDFWEWTVKEKPKKSKRRDRDEVGEGIEEVEWVEVIQNALIFEEQTLRPPRVMEGYNYLPYTIGFFKPTGKENSGDWGKGIIQPLETSVIETERSINRRSRQISVYSSLPPIARTQAGRKVQVDAAIGKVVHLGPGEDFGFPQWPGNPPDVEQQIAFFRSKVQQSGFSDVMMGAGASQVSGYALSQLGDQNRIRLTQPIIHSELFWALWGKKILNLTKTQSKGAAVRVYGRMKGRKFFEQIPADDFDQFLVTAQVRPEFPNEKARKHAMANQARDILSPTTLMERYYDIDQPDEEREKRLSALIEQHPIMIQYAVARNLQAIIETAQDPAEIAAATMMLQAMEQQGIIEERAGENVKYEQPTGGLASSSGALTDQEQGGEPVGQSISDQLDAMANQSVSPIDGV